VPDGDDGRRSVVVDVIEVAVGVTKAAEVGPVAVPSEEHFDPGTLTVRLLPELYTHVALAYAVGALCRPGRGGGAERQEGTGEREKEGGSRQPQSMAIRGWKGRLTLS